MKTAVAVGVMTVLFAVTAPSARATQFQSCGQLTPGVEPACILFEADRGGTFHLDNLDSFQVGDRVCVTGQLDAACVTSCLQGNGCIRDNTITPAAAECAIVAFGGTVENIAKEKKGQSSIHVTCDSTELVLLGPPDAKKPNPHPTYVRITSILDSGSREYVDIMDGVPEVPLREVCLQEVKGEDDSATYEAIVLEPTTGLPDTKFQIKMSRKEIKAKDCALGVPCSRYTSEVRVDKAKIGDTTGSSCVFMTMFEIFEGALGNGKGTCLPRDDSTLTVSQTALWRNPKLGDCDARPPGLRTP